MRRVAWLLNGLIGFAIVSVAWWGCPMDGFIGLFVGLSAVFLASVGTVCSMVFVGRFYGSELKFSGTFLLMSAALILFGISLRVTNYLVHARPKSEWIRPDADEAKTILNGIGPAFEDNFCLAAANGKWKQEPSEGHPIRDFAVYVFSSKLSASLQPGSMTAGAMRALFIPDSKTLRMDRNPDERNSGQPFVVNGKIKIAYSLVRGKKSKEWEDEATVLCHGLFSRETHRVMVVDITSPESAQKNAHNKHQ